MINLIYNYILDFKYVFFCAVRIILVSNLDLFHGPVDAV